VSPSRNTNTRSEAASPSVVKARRCAVLVERKPHQARYPGHRRTCCCTCLQPATAREEVGVHVPRSKRATVRPSCCYGCEDVACPTGCLPRGRPSRYVAAGGRIADLRLGAPAVGVATPERAPDDIESRGYRSARGEDVQVAQGPLALGDSRRVVAVPGLTSSVPRMTPRACARAAVREPGDEAGASASLEIEHVAVHNDDRVDRDGGRLAG